MSAFLPLTQYSGLDRLDTRRIPMQTQIKQTLNCMNRLVFSTGTEQPPPLSPFLTIMFSWNHKVIFPTIVRPRIGINKLKFSPYPKKGERFLVFSTSTVCTLPCSKPWFNCRGGFMLIHDHKNNFSTSIDFRPAAPGKATPSQYTRQQQFNYVSTLGLIRLNKICWSLRLFDQLYNLENSVLSRKI